MLLSMCSSLQCINKPILKKRREKGEEFEECKGELYKATNFACADWHANNQEQLNAHNKLCKECAIDDLRCPECPEHSGGFFVRDDTPEPA